MVLHNPATRLAHARIVRQYKINNGTATPQDILDQKMSDAIQAGIASGRNPIEFMLSAVAAHKAAKLEATGRLREGQAAQVAELLNVPAVPISVIKVAQPKEPTPGA